jgi:hypothetical protein
VRAAELIYKPRSPTREGSDSKFSFEIKILFFPVRAALDFFFKIFKDTLNLNSTNPPSHFRNEAVLTSLEGNESHYSE